MIKGISVRNWRSIGPDGVKIELAPITVIAGANDSGKTGFLISSYAALSSESKQIDNWLFNNLYFEGSKHDFNIKNTETYIEVTMSLIDKIFKKIVSLFDDKYVQDIDPFLGPSLSNFMLENKKVLHSFLENYKNELFNKTTFTISNKTKMGASHRELILDNFKKSLMDYLNKLDIAYSNNDFNYIIEFINENYFELFKGNNILTYFITANRYFDPSRSNSELREEELKDHTLGHEPSDLVKYVQKIRSGSSMREGKYQRLLKYVEILLPEVERIEAEFLEDRPHRDVYLEIKQNGKIKRQPLSRSGSGISNIIFIACRLLCDLGTESKYDCIYFIDEPETGLHPKLQVRFMKLLRELSKDFSVQWVIATHSPFIMKNLKQGENLYLFEHDGEKTNARLIDLANKQLVIEALGSYLPETLTAKGVIYVEGATEARFIPIALKKCGFDIDKEGLVIVPLGGDNLFQIDPKDIKKIHPKSMIVIDSDLVNSPKNGGNLSKKKIDMEKACKENQVEFFMSRDYRFIENLYPKSVLAKVLNISEQDLEFGPYDEIPQITDKVRIGQQVAEQMDKNQIEQLQLIKAIKDWWE